LKSGSNSQIFKALVIDLHDSIDPHENKDSPLSRCQGSGYGQMSPNNQIHENICKNKQKCLPEIRGLQVVADLEHFGHILRVSVQTGSFVAQRIEQVLLCNLETLLLMHILHQLFSFPNYID
jgi:hypothetical protein